MDCVNAINCCCQLFGVISLFVDSSVEIDVLLLMDSRISISTGFREAKAIQASTAETFQGRRCEASKRTLSTKSVN